MYKISVSLVAFAVFTLTISLAALASSKGDDKSSKAAQVTPAMLTQGKAVYEKNCAACHATGVAGAPKLGDKSAWKKLNAEGLHELTEDAIRGKGAMPPRGGNPKLSDAEVRAAVAYLMENSR